jgi:hypothetical protein
MQYWLVAFAAALVVVIGFAAGPIGAVVAVVAFSVALFSLWASKLGFAGAWTRFGLDRFTAPFWKGENWDRLGEIFGDREKLVKASTVAVGLIALFLVLPPSQVLIAVAAVAVWYAFEINRANKPVTRPYVATSIELADKTTVYGSDTRAEHAKIN